MSKSDWGLVGKALRHYRVHLTRTWAGANQPARAGLLRQLWLLEIHARKESQ